MRCTDRRVGAGLIGPGLLLVLAGCSPTPTPTPTPSAPAAGRVAQQVSPSGPTPPLAQGEAPASVPPRRHATRPTALPLPPPRPVANWNDVRRQAAQRIVDANPDGTYLGKVPEPLLAIPVLEIELKRDGSVARIVLLRAPRQAKDTSAMAIAAVHRAAPFGDVSKLPRPWRFTETFLFDDARKFKPRTLDE